jgi:hypothetical protein
LSNVAQAQAQAPASATVLARNFNMRYPWQPITVHAARKWLLGEAIPTQDKMRVIAEWLSVSVMWLRYGEGEEAAAKKGQHGVEPESFNSGDIKLLEDVRALKGYERRLVNDLVQMFLQNQDEIRERVSLYRADNDTTLSEST